MEPRTKKTAIIQYQIIWVPGKVQLVSHRLLFAGFGYFPLRNQSRTEQMNI